ncbi:hypothetical protein P7C71_g5055, partial [Lecanoromycetidae sp. Uapishka_2]
MSIAPSTSNICHTPAFNCYNRLRGFQQAQDWCLHRCEPFLVPPPASQCPQNNPLCELLAELEHKSSHDAATICNFHHKPHFIHIQPHNFLHSKQLITSDIDSTLIFQPLFFPRSIIHNTNLLRDFDITLNLIRTPNTNKLCSFKLNAIVIFHHISSILDPNFTNSTHHQHHQHHRNIVINNDLINTINLIHHTPTTLMHRGLRR